MLNQNKRRLYAIILLCSLLLCACKGTEGDSHNGIVVTTSLQDQDTLVGDIPCEFPLVKEPVSMNILLKGYRETNPEDVYVWKKYEEMTGVNIDWVSVGTPGSKFDEVVYSALMNRRDVDIIIRGRISSDQLAQYGKGGYIYDLTKDDMLQKYAPNCWAYLSSHPDALASIMEPDGRIYALPQINSGPELRVSRKLLINKKWLDNLDMEVPKTTEEFYQLMKAFKEQDANGNGDPNDEIPLCSQDWLSIQESFYGAFGLANRGVHNLMVDCDEQTGKTRLVEAADGYRDFLEYFHRLYSEGLLYQNAFTVTLDQWLTFAEEDRIGAYANTNLATLPSDKADQWVAVEDALIGPNGDRLWSGIRANFHSTGAAFIPTTCKNPELALRWLDYFWTDEGTLFYHMGIENETFVTIDDHTYDYSPKIYEEIKNGGGSFDDVVATYSPYPGGGNPTVEIAPYFRGGEMADVPANAARKLFQYGPKEYWPNFTFTAEENERLWVIKADIKKYSTEAYIMFITGEKPLTEWEDYKTQLKKLGEDEMLAIYQTAVERYYNLIDETGK